MSCHVQLTVRSGGYTSPKPLQTSEAAEGDRPIMVLLHQLPMGHVGVSSNVYAHIDVREMTDFSQSMIYMSPSSATKIFGSLRSPWTESASCRVWIAVRMRNLLVNLWPSYGASTSLPTTRSMITTYIPMFSFFHGTVDTAQAISRRGACERLRNTNRRT